MGDWLLYLLSKRELIISLMDTGGLPQPPAKLTTMPDVVVAAQKVKKVQIYLLANNAFFLCTGIHN